MRLTASSLDTTDFAPASGENFDIRNLSQEQLMQLGMAEMAYVRAVWMNGVTAFAIYAADGSPMAMAADCELAVAAIMQHEMQAVSVH